MPDPVLLRRKTTDGRTDDQLTTHSSRRDSMPSQIRDEKSRNPFTQQVCESGGERHTKKFPNLQNELRSLDVALCSPKQGRFVRHYRIIMPGLRRSRLFEPSSSLVAGAISRDSVDEHVRTSTVSLRRHRFFRYTWMLFCPCRE